MKNLFKILILLVTINTTISLAYLYAAQDQTQKLALIAPDYAQRIAHEEEDPEINLQIISFQKNAIPAKSIAMLQHQQNLKNRSEIAHNIYKLLGRYSSPPYEKNETDGGKKEKVGTPLHEAVSNGDIAQVTQILEETNNRDVNTGDKNGETPLHLAVFGQSIAIVWKLLMAKAYANIPNIMGQTPEYLAYRMAIALKCTYESEKQIDQNQPKQSPSSRRGQITFKRCNRMPHFISSIGNSMRYRFGSGRLHYQTSQRPQSTNFVSGH